MISFLVFSGIISQIQPLVSLNMTKVFFDKMKPEHLDQIHQLEINNYPVPWSKGIIKDCIRSDYHGVVLKNSQQSIIGYAFLMTACDESHLLNMCVDKGQQGQGLGRKFLRYLENMGKYNRCKVFLLEVRESNTVAKNLYQSFGFEVVGIRKGYYKTLTGRENAIVMTKALL